MEEERRSGKDKERRSGRGKRIKKSLFGFHDISTLVGYLMPNPLYTDILDIYDLVWLGFLAYQPL